MYRYTVDRLEDQAWAVIEDEESRTLRVPIAWLPDGVSEGDVIDVSEEGGGAGTRVLRLQIDASGKAERLDQARQLRDALPSGPKGNVSL